MHRDFANLNEKSSIEQGHGVSRGVLQILHMVDSATFIAGDAHTVVPCLDDLQGTSKVFYVQTIYDLRSTKIRKEDQVSFLIFVDRRS